MAGSGHVLANQGATIVRILLVNLPHDRRETQFPLELAGIAGVLKTQGHEFDGFDFGTRPSGSWPAVADSYDVVLSSAASSTWSRVRDALQKLDRSRRRLTMVVGAYTTLYPDEVLAEPAVDVVILGEAELADETVTVRHMDRGEQETIEQQHVGKWLQHHL